MIFQVLWTANAEARLAGLELYRLRRDFPDWRIEWGESGGWRAIRKDVDLVADGPLALRGLLTEHGDDHGCA